MGVPDRLQSSQEPSTLAAEDLLTVAGAGRHVPMFYWERPSEGVSMLGLGAAWDLSTSGGERFAVASQAAVAALGKGTRSCDRRFGPFVLGGFGFSDDDCRQDEWREFPSLRLWIPELLWVRRGGANAGGDDRLREALAPERYREIVVRFFDTVDSTKEEDRVPSMANGS